MKSILNSIEMTIGRRNFTDEEEEADFVSDLHQNNETNSGSTVAKMKGTQKKPSSLQVRIDINDEFGSSPHGNDSFGNNGGAPQFRPSTASKSIKSGRPASVKGTKVHQRPPTGGGNTSPITNAEVLTISDNGDILVVSMKQRLQFRDEYLQALELKRMTIEDGIVLFEIRQRVALEITCEDLTNEKRIRVEDRARKTLRANKNINNFEGAKVSLNLANTNLKGAESIHVIDDETKTLITKIETMNVLEVQEGQVKIMKEKRELNIKKSNWVQAFKTRSQRTPKASDFRGDVLEVEKSLKKLDIISEAFHKRHLELAESSFYLGTMRVSATKEQEMQLRNKEENLKKSAVELHDALIKRGAKVEKFKRTAEVTKERTKCMKAKRSLKISKKEWESDFVSLYKRAPDTRDKNYISEIISIISQVDDRIDALDKRDCEINGTEYKPRHKIDEEEDNDNHAEVANDISKHTIPVMDNVTTDTPSPPKGARPPTSVGGRPKTCAGGRPKTAAHVVEEYVNLDFDNKNQEKLQDCKKPIDSDAENLPGWQDCINTHLASSAHAAAYHGHYQVLEYLSKKFDMFTEDDKGRTPLFYASVRNHVSCVALLVSMDSYWLEVGDQRGDTPLHASVASNSLAVTAFLLESGTNPNVANNSGLTPAHLATSIDALQVLQNFGADFHYVDDNSRMALWSKCSEGKHECAKYLCEAMNKDYIPWADSSGDTPLHVASEKGHYQCVSVLCSNCVDWSIMNAFNNKNYTPAHLASSQPVLKVLYEFGADIFIQNNVLRTPLFFAAAKGRLAVVAFLLNICKSARPDLPDVADTNGDTPLHVAALAGHYALVNLLSPAMKDPSVKNKRGLSALELAASNGHQNIVTSLQQIVQQTSAAIGPDWETVANVIQWYGSRWCRELDPESGMKYFYDRATGTSMWDMPEDYDGEAISEEGGDDREIYEEQQGEEGEWENIEHKDDEEIASSRIVDNQIQLRDQHADENNKRAKKVDKLRSRNEQVKNILRMFFVEQNPSKLKDLDMIIESRAPDYERLFMEIEKKYRTELPRPDFMKPDLEYQE